MGVYSDFMWVRLMLAPAVAELSLLAMPGMYTYYRYTVYCRYLLSKAV